MPYSRNEEYGLITVAKALYSIGVTVIYQPCLSKEQVRGATLCINEKPCIVISDLWKKYPTLWFSLMHELYHVLYDLEDISRKCYHISSDYGDLMLTNEDRADYFAQQILLSDDKLNFIEGYINSHINVLSYAQLVDAKIHPEKYPNLIVRVWGFSAYFNDLPEEYKDNLIQRAELYE